jgi:hypothetical protein
MQVVPSATIRYYKTLSPDDIIEKQNNIAKWVFNVKEGDPLVHFHVDNSGYFYYYDYRPFDRNLRAISDTEKAYKLLRYHVDILHQKLQMSLSGDPSNPIKAAFFNWENLNEYSLLPSLGTDMKAWKAILHINLASISQGSRSIPEKKTVVGEYIEIEFTAKHITHLKYKHLPYIQSHNTRLVSQDQSGKKLINTVSYRRIDSNLLYPYYSYGGTLIPAVEGIDNIIVYSNDTPDLPEPQFIGNANTLFQVISGTKPSREHSVSGSVGLRMNYAIEFVTHPERTINPSLRQASMVNEHINKTFRNELEDIVLSYPPQTNNSPGFRFLNKKHRRTASDYYSVKLEAFGAFQYTPGNSLWRACQNLLYPITNHKAILCMEYEWPDTTPIESDILLYTNFKKQILEAEHSAFKRVPIIKPPVQEAIARIERFCITSGLSLALLEMIKENPVAYKNHSLIIGDYLYVLTKEDTWLMKKLSEYNILLFPDLESSLLTGPNTPRKDIRESYLRNRFYHISDIFSELFKADIFFRADFKFKKQGRLIKAYHAINIWEIKVALLNPELNKLNPKHGVDTLTRAVLDVLGGSRSSAIEKWQEATTQNKIVNCLQNWNP